MSKPHYFHFTLGPVQGFVAQARRTRDFWAGSFLLSWLSAVAIKAVQMQEGKILFPAADPNYLQFLTGDGNKGKEPKQGSIPNRFKAEIKDIAAFDPQQITQAVQEAWQALADDIWWHDINTLRDKDSQTGKIWDRQIAHFWDMSWIVTDEINHSSALDQRKNWRSYVAPDEAGVKCAMMEGWQELSAETTPHRMRMEQNFWQRLRDSNKTGIKSDLAKNEALCAIAFVKRRFSRYFNQFEHTIEQTIKPNTVHKKTITWTLKGWDIPSAVPSVAYMAAVHWLESAITTAEPATLQRLVSEARQLNVEYGEWQTDIRCIKEAKVNSKSERIFKALDGNIFYATLLENPKQYENQQQAQKVLAALKDINKSAQLEPVSPFYAILMMDGDSLGSKMSQLANQQLITDGLAAFTKGVANKVYAHNGFLIYAGGDDVLAILPLEDAIPCAISLRQHYMACFKDKNSGKMLIDTTLSGAIEYVHIKTPLTKVLKDAHHLLDDIAKDKTGRDALAIRVWKPGGLQQQWAQPWKIALYDDPYTMGKKTSYLEKLIKDFQAADALDEQFSSKFLYKIRERFALLNPSKQDASQYDPVPQVFNEQQAIRFMAMEYLNSGNTTPLSQLKTTAERITQAENIVRPLLTQCRPVIRKLEPPQNKPEWQYSQRLEADGALLVRFLAHKGIER